MAEMDPRDRLHRRREEKLPRGMTARQLETLINSMDPNSPDFRQVDFAALKRRALLDNLGYKAMELLDRQNPPDGPLPRRPKPEQ